MKQTVPCSHASQPAERRSRAFLRLLADICRRFPDLREWLFEDFARDAQTRANFLVLIEKDALDGEGTADGFAEMAGELGPWLQEKRRIQGNLPARAVKPFGGLTWDEMESLVRRYEARTLRLDVFLLVRDWRKAGEAAKASPKLLRTSAGLLDQAIRSGDTKLLTQLVQAVHFLTDLEQGRLQSAFGYADWWKLHALVYMLRHPREAYRTRDVRAHLATLRLEISSLDFRRFCNRHGIRRDERAGRPRTNVVAIKREAGAGLAPVRSASPRGGTGRGKAS
jgi:hypothetical protein